MKHVFFLALLPFSIDFFECIACFVLIDKVCMFMINKLLPIDKQCFNYRGTRVREYIR